MTAATTTTTNEDLVVRALVQLAERLPTIRLGRIDVPVATAALFEALQPLAAYVERTSGATWINLDVAVALCQCIPRDFRPPPYFPLASPRRQRGFTPNDNAVIAWLLMGMGFPGRVWRVGRLTEMWHAVSLLVVGGGGSDPRDPWRRVRDHVMTTLLGRAGKRARDEEEEDLDHATKRLRLE